MVGLLPAVIVVIVVVVVVTVSVLVIKYRKTSSTTGGGGSTSQASAPGPGVVTMPTVPSLPYEKPTVMGDSVRIVPRDTIRKVEYWSDKWRFNQPDVGHVSFIVNKNSGLIVSLSDQPGYPKGGYAFVIDERGGQTTNFADTTTSATYLTRLPQMECPASNSALVRNVELQNQPRRIDIDYRHGIVELSVDGVMVIGYNDPFPMSNVSYVGFGDTGLKSGEGIISDLVID